MASDGYSRRHKACKKDTDFGLFRQHPILKEAPNSATYFVMQGGLLEEKGVGVLKERFAKQWFERGKELRCPPRTPNK